MANEITNSDFFKGGHAIFTVSNPQGVRYTFKIKQGNFGKAVEADSPYFASLLTGPDNNSSYTYMGMFNPNNYTCRLTRASKYTSDSLPWRVLNWVLRITFSGQNLPEGYGLQHEGKCCRCGRKLTTPESIDRGIGPECAKK